MTTLVTWDFVNDGKKDFDCDEFLRVKPDCNLKVRLIDNPVKIVKIFRNDKKCILLDNEDVGQQLIAKYDEKLSNISIRFACWCIDRNSNSMKILDMPISVARSIGHRTKAVNRNIAGVEEGCDWMITTNGKKGKDVRYDVIYLEDTSLTNEEQQMLKEKKDGGHGHFDLTKIFKSCSYEEAEEKFLMDN